MTKTNQVQTEAKAHHQAEEGVVIVPVPPEETVVDAIPKRAVRSVTIG